MSFFEGWFYLNLHVGHHRLVILLQVVWLVHGLALGSQAIQVLLQFYAIKSNVNRSLDKT